MKQVILQKHKPNEVIEIVRGLRAQGLVQGKDFDFSYNQTAYSEDGWSVTEPEHTVFTFYDDKWATWFTLKWA